VGVTYNQISPVLKTLFPDGFETEVYKDSVLFALMKKTKKFGGDSKKIPLVYGDPQARSATFSKAYARRGSAPSSAAFALTRKKDYAIVSLDTETILATEGDDAAFVSAVKLHTQGALNNLKQAMGIDAFGTGSGVRGQIKAASAVNTTTCNLQVKEDIGNIEKGMVLEVSATNGGGAGVRAGTLTVATVDRDAGTFTCTAVLNVGIAAIAAGDYIFAEGDYDSKFSGLQAWLPAVAPAPGDNFYGVDRSADAVRLAGIRFDATQMNQEDALINFQARANLEGGKPEYGIMNPMDRAALITLLGNRVQRRQLEVGGIGFSSVVVTGDKGDMDVISDRRCPRYTAFGLQMDTWEFHSIGDSPRVLKNTDGGDWQMEDASDASQYRLGYFGNASCNAPGWNGRIALAQ
jgi:hypothetical protein